MKHAESLISVVLCLGIIVQTKGQGPFLGQLSGGPITNGTDEDDAGPIGTLADGVLGKAAADQLRLMRDNIEELGFNLATKGLFLSSGVLPSCIVPYKVDCKNPRKCKESKAKKKTWMLLYTKKNPDNPEVLNQCGGKLPKNTNFNPSHDTEIFIHGWLDGVCRTQWMREMKNALFERGDYNVILIDWSWGNGPEYDKGAKNVYVVAKPIASMIKNIMKQTKVGPNRFHLIGHSFGSHISGLVGQCVPNLRRITGLDPALTPFMERPISKRLDPGDAEIVDVIHSNGGKEGGVTIGEIYPIGDADFYPNGGKEQKNCIISASKALLKLDLLYGFTSILYPELCSHIQSIEYYKTSINPTQCESIGHLCADYETYNAGKCDSCGQNDLRCAVMGMDYEHKPHLVSDEGHYLKYYLNTTNDAPYCDKGIADIVPLPNV